MNIETTLTYERETRNKVVYSNDKPGAPVDKIYIPKPLALQASGYPTTIQLTITEVSE